MGGAEAHRGQSTPGRPAHRRGIAVVGPVPARAWAVTAWCKRSSSSRGATAHRGQFSCRAPTRGPATGYVWRMRLPILLLLVCGVLAGCGNDESRAVGGEEQSRQTEGQSEAIYIPLGGLKYQVQISRVLNPFSREDAAYLSGVRGDLTALEQGRCWFGVFMRVENDSTGAHSST